MNYLRSASYAHLPLAVFAVSPKNERFMHSSFATDIYQLGRGMYEGQTEMAVVCPTHLFYQRIVHSSFAADQETWIRLAPASDQTLNLRAAQLRHFRKPDADLMGLWLEVTEQEAQFEPGWSLFDNHWYTVRDQRQIELDRQHPNWVC